MSDDSKNGTGTKTEAGATVSAGPGGSSAGSAGPDAQAPAQAVIAIFGGIRPMANTLGVAVSTVQGWKERALIPAGRHDDIRAAATKAGVTLDPDLLAAAGRHETDRPADQSIASKAAAGSTPPAAETKAPETKAPETKAPETKAQETKAQETKAQKTGSSGGAPGGAKPASAQPASARPEIAKPSPDRTTTDRTTAPPSKTPPHKTSRGSTVLVTGMVLGALLLGGGFAAAVVLRDHWLPLFPVEQTGGDPVTDLLALIDSQETRLAALEGRGSGDLSAVETDVAGLRTQVADLAERLAGIETRDTPLAQRIAGLESELGLLSDELARASGLAPEAVARLTGSQADLQGRLDSLERALGKLDSLTTTVEGLAAATTDAPAGPPADLSFLLAAFQLRDALERGTPFAGPLEALQGGLGGDPALTADLEKLRGFADTGVPTIDLLQAAYPAMAKTVVAAERSTMAGEGWWAGALRRIFDQVPLRQVGLVEGDTPSARVARAEFHLDAGDLGQAVAELEGLTGATRAAADPWLEEARARAAAEATLAALVARIGQAASAGGD